MEVIVLGAGYSITKGIELGLWNKIKSKEIWSINSIYKIMPFLPTREIFTDPKFFTYEVGELQKLYEKGVKIVSRKHPKMAFLQDKITQYECIDNVVYVTWVIHDSVPGRTLVPTRSRIYYSINSQSFNLSRGGTSSGDNTYSAYFDKPDGNGVIYLQARVLIQEYEFVSTPPSTISTESCEPLGENKWVKVSRSAAGITRGTNS